MTSVKYLFYIYQDDCVIPVLKSICRLYYILYLQKLDMTSIHSNRCMTRMGSGVKFPSILLREYYFIYSHLGDGPKAHLLSLPPSLFHPSLSPSLSLSISLVIVSLSGFPLSVGKDRLGSAVIRSSLDILLVFSGESTWASAFLCVETSLALMLLLA